jgi:hypothetical protein
MGPAAGGTTAQCQADPGLHNLQMVIIYGWMWIIHLDFP